MIFAVFDVLLAVNMCINYSFFYIYLFMNSQLQNDNKIQIRKTIDIKANATVRPQGISLIDAFITNISS